MEKKKKFSILRALTYLLCFIVVFFVALYYLFPYDKVKSLAEIKLSEATSMDATIKELTFSPLSGAKLSGITFETVINNAAVKVLHIDQLTVKPSYLSLFSDKITGSINSKLYGGAADGEVTLGKVPGKGRSNINFTFTGIDISGNHVIRELYGFEPFGKLNGYFAFELAEGAGVAGYSHITVSGGGVNGIVLDGIGSGLIRFDNMKLPDIRFDKLNLNFEKKQNMVRIKSLNVEGNDVKGTVSGSININKNIKASTGNLKIKFNLSEEYVNKEEVLSLFESGFSNFKDSAGYYNIKLEGTLIRPKIRNI